MTTTRRLPKIPLSRMKKSCKTDLINITCFPVFLALVRKRLQQNQTLVSTQEEESAESFPMIKSSHNRDLNQRFNAVLYAMAAFFGMYFPIAQHVFIRVVIKDGYTRRCRQQRLKGKAWGTINQGYLVQQSASNGSEKPEVPSTEQWPTHSEI